jgi:predicted AAA+ superfamily ATPase
MTGLFFQGKGIVLLGPRQVGKTTLLKSIVEKLGKSSIWYNADEPQTRELLEGIGSAQMKTYFGDAEVIVIDEAQRIPNIGLTAKIAIEAFPEKQIVLTGSSSLELQSNISEPLTGRKYEFHLFPVSFEELVKHSHLHAEMQELENRLIFGSYPEIVTNPARARQHLKLLADSYLFKDLLNYEGIKKPQLLTKLLQALAYQLGSEVSYTELGNMLSVDKNTIEKYIDLLEKSFVVFRLSALSRNARNEIKKGKKVYFYDTGIRNALIGNFEPINTRGDKGALWENFLVSERLKLLNYTEFYGQTYFWRTFQQQEIDYLEEADGKISAYEFKWKKGTKARASQTFTSSYNMQDFKVINTGNYYEFLTA